MHILQANYCALHPEKKIEMLPSLGSSGGIQALKAGAIDLAISSRPVKETEKNGLKVHYLGMSPLVFAVHPDTTLTDVTTAQLVNIYLGRMSTWRDGSHIRRFLRPENDSDWRMMENFSPELASALKTASATKGLFLAVTDTDAISYLERVPGSFGPTTLALIRAEKRKVKIISLNGVDPVSESPGPEYPLQKPYYLVMREDASPAVDAFLEFILSQQGQNILANTGVTVAGKEGNEK